MNRKAKKKKTSQPKLKLEITLYGKRDVILKNLKEAVEWVEANVRTDMQWIHRSAGIDYILNVRQLTREDWFPGKK